MREYTSPDRPAPDTENPYRPYMAYASALQDTRRHAAMLFHDGNAGHFWRGELASQAGEIFFTVGLILWITYLTYSPVTIALIVVMQALPWALSGPLGASLQGAAEPSRMLRSVGLVRMVCALGLVGLQLLHYRGILAGFEYPIVYALVFLAALAGRLRAHLRVAAAQVCLAPGELEHVADDLQIGSAVVAVVTPLLAALFFILLGARILLVAISAAIAFFISLNAEGLLDALPFQRRVVTWATLEMEVEDERLRAELQEAAQPDEKKGAAFDEEQSVELDILRADRALPEWLQPGPRSTVAGIADVRAGLGLSGLASSSRTSLYLLGSLALIGGGLAALEVFYIVYVLQLPAFYLGPLLACEAGGLVFGGFMASGMLAKDGWRGAIALGLAGMGAALVLLGLFPVFIITAAAAALLGTGNALTVSGARRGLRAGYDGPERRALTAAETFVSGLCGAAGAGIFLWFYLYLSPTYVNLQRVVSFGPLQRFNLSPSFAPWSLSELFLVTGLLLLALCVFVGALLAAGGVGPRPRKVGLPRAGLAGGLTGGLALSGEGEGWADDEDGAYGPDGEYDPPYDSRYAPAPRRPAPYGRASAYRGSEHDDDDYGGRGGYGPAGYDEDDGW